MAAAPAAGTSVVNLLDLRDEEEDKGGNLGGRWANRNPKAKAKAGGRRRRRGNEEKAGFGGRQRAASDGHSMSSMVSGLSQLSGDESEPGKEHDDAASGPPKRMSGSSVEKNSLLAQLQGQEDASSKGDVTRDLLQRDDGSRGSTGSGEVEVFSEARQIAQLRYLLRGQDPGAKGPHFKQNVWEFYMVKASWSDGLCVALNHSNMYACCFIPCCWPFRLYQTIVRSAPLKIKMCKCCEPRCGTCCACPLVSVIFLLPILAGLTFMPQVSEFIKTTIQGLPFLDGQDMDAVALWVSIGLCALTLFLMVFWWARVLLAVGMKYNILEAMDKPDKFACKTMCCICATNTRVGLHVDRAQGYEKILKQDRTTIELSDTIGKGMVNPPGQDAMV